MVIYRLDTSNSIINDESYANKISFVGNDMYACGGRSNASGDDIIVYWKNGVEYPLENPTNVQMKTNDMFLLGSDVYIAGNEWDVDQPSLASYWKNGKLYNLTTDLIYEHRARANGIFVVE